MDEKLINLVENYPIIYDKTEKNHRNVKAKDKVWKEIAEEMNIPMETLKKRWELLRNRYTLEKRKMKVSSSATTSANKDWKYLDQLRFLDETPSNNQTSGNIQGWSDSNDDCSNRPFEWSAAALLKNRAQTPESDKDVSEDLTSISTDSDNSEVLSRLMEQMKRFVDIVNNRFKPPELTPVKAYFQTIGAMVDSAKLSDTQLSSLQGKILEIIREEFQKNGIMG